MRSYKMPQQPVDKGLNPIWRGVGFVPQRWIWRALFSGWACAAALLLAAVLKLQH